VRLKVLNTALKTNKVQLYIVYPLVSRLRL